MSQLWALRMWDAKTGEQPVAFSSDGNLVSGSDDYLDRVWDADTGEQLKELEGQNSCQIGSTSDDNYKK